MALSLMLINGFKYTFEPHFSDNKKFNKSIPLPIFRVNTVKQVVQVVNEC